MFSQSPLRSLMKVLVALALLTLLPACGSDLEEKEVGQINIIEVGTGDQINAIRFSAAAVGDQLQPKSLILINESSSVGLTIKTLELTTSSPLLTMTQGGQGGTSFTDIELARSSQTQVDLFYNPSQSDLGCGEPPTSAPSGCELPTFEANYCGHIVVTSNDPSDPCRFLPIYIPSNSGAVQVTPQTLEFRAASVGDMAQTQTFLVENVGADQLSLQGIDINLEPAEAFTLEGGSSSATIPPGGQVGFELVLEATSADVNDTTGTVIVRSNDPSRPAEAITVIVGDPGGSSMSVMPEMLTYSGVANPATDTQSVTVTNDGDGAPLLVSVSLRPSDAPDYTVFNDAGEPVAGPPCRDASPPASCSAQLQINQSGSHVFDITYAPQTQDATDATLVFRGGVAGTIEVALSATGGAGSVSISPDPLVLTGPGAVGASASGMLTVSNSGTVSVDLGDVTLSNDLNPASCDHFEVESAPTNAAPVAIAPGTDQMFNVRYDRPDPDDLMFEHECTATFSHDSGNGSTTVLMQVTYQ